jgi:multidrug transporter EmrE-like cation transporter
MDKPSWPSALVAVAFVALVGLMLWRATESLHDFSTIWSGVGGVVGVLTGAIPSYFFAQKQATTAVGAQKRAEAYALIAPPSPGGPPPGGPAAGAVPAAGVAPPPAAPAHASTSEWFRTNLAPIIVAIFFIALVAFILQIATTDHRSFTAIWAGAGTVVGVVTGAIPNYFFAKQATANASTAHQNAVETAQLAPAVDPEKVQDLMRSLP